MDTWTMASFPVLIANEVVLLFLTGWVAPPTVAPPIGAPPLAAVVAIVAPQSHRQLLLV